MNRRRKPTKAELTTVRGDVCDSTYEKKVIDDLIGRGVDYEFHPGPYEYSRPCRGGFCLDCDSNNVRKGALYTPDLRLVRQDIIVELKGGSMTAASRGRLRDFCKSCGFVLYFMFRDDRFIKKGSKTRHRRWAERIGCIVHIGMEIPDEWT